ncbi:hypothetical protein ACFL7M_19355, partial [Thermodesulfobacteriota bacterium]
SEWQVTDEGNLQYIIQYEAGEDGASDRIHVYDFNYTYQYNFSGSFVDGPVYVNFLAGRWQDNVGNTSLAETEYFGVISQAPSFEIMIEGSLELHGGGFTPDYNGDGTPDPLFSLRGKVVLNIDAVKHPVSGEILEARFTLDISATLELIYLGNVASAAGRFILVMGDANDSSEDSSIFGSNKLKFWGVLSFQTNLEKLRAIGIEANATALLMVNSTGETKIETISLEGIKGDKLFTMGDSDISSQLPQDLSPSSFIQEIPQALRDAFVGAGIEISANLQVQGVEPGTRWKIYDNDAGKQYFIDKDGNSLHIYGEAQRFELEGKSFSIALAGALLFKIPPIQEDSPELFRLSGVFYMKIKLDGLDISLEAFVNAELTIGLESDPLLRFTALGVLLIRLSETESYFAMLLELEFNMGTSAILSFEANFNLYINTSGVSRGFLVPGLFLDPTKGYLSQHFIDGLEYGTGDLLFPINDSDDSLKTRLDNFYDGETNSGTADAALVDDLKAAGLTLNGQVTIRVIHKQDRWEISDADGNAYIIETNASNPDFLNVYGVASGGRYYVNIPRGPPQIDGSLGTAGPYIVISGAGKLTIAEVFILEGAFRFELSVDRLQLQVAARLKLGPLGEVKAFGFLEINDQGLIGVIRLDASFPGLKEIGIEFAAYANFVLNTTSQDTPITIMFGPGDSETFLIPKA